MANRKLKMNSIFHYKYNKEITVFEKSLLAKLNASDDLNVNIASPRIIGDTAQEIIENCFKEGIPSNIGTAIQKKFARRSMADMAFVDIFNNYVIVDVKTHNIDTVFNMPNLTSVKRIASLYEDDENYFSLLIAKYTTVKNRAEFLDIVFIPIEHLSWDCLTIGALGWGQIQIADAKNIKTDRKQTRKSWMISLCDALAIFYPKELLKINERIEEFRKIRRFWENKP